MRKYWNMKHFYAMTNTQKLEGIKSAKMRKLRERRTTHLVLFQSNHNTFFSNCCKVHLQCSITDPLLKGFLWHYSKPLFPPNRGIFPNSSSGKNKNSIPVNGNTWNYSKPDTWKDSQEVFQQFIRKNVDIKKKKILTVLRFSAEIQAESKKKE